jgi:nucleoside-diphosphate-sugar epimerase
MSTVFLTGGTGVVGNAIARAILEKSTARLILLLRGRSDAEVQERLQTLLLFWKLPAADVTGRVEVARGDTSLPLFGLDPKRFERIVGVCTRLIHCAALVRMNLPLVEARASAVNAAQNVVEFARASAHTGSIQKVEFLSTVGVGGTRPGILPERWINESRNYHNTYEQAKAEAEVVVAAGVAEGLPITVHRPSMVVGDSRTGEVIRFQIFYHLVEFLSGRRTFGFFPTFGATRLDIVPVDYVADAVVWSSGRKDTGGLVLHLCSGAEESPKLDELQSRVRASFVAAGLDVPQRISLPPKILRAAIPVIRTLLPSSGRRALSTLPIFLAYLSGDQGFGNTETRRILGGAGISLPPVDTYLGKVLERYVRTKLLETKA